MTDHQRLREALAQLRPEDSLEATFAHWHDTPTKKGGFALTPCSYAVAILINRRVEWIIWGAGYSPEAIPPVVFGIKALLQVVPPGRRLEVHALKALDDAICHDGYGRYAMDHGGKTKTSGKPLGCYPAIADIINAYDSRRWSFTPYRHMAEAPGYSEAEEVAKGQAKTAALKHKADFAPTTADHLKPIILQEFVDVFPQ